MLNDGYIQFSYIIITIFTIVILSIYLIRLKRVKYEINESSNIVGIIINELKQRLSIQDKKIVDQEVKIDILELKVNKLLRQEMNKSYNNLKDIKLNEKVNDVISIKDKISHDIIKFNKTEKIILDSLVNKEYSANELQLKINKTREHTSRLLKNLYNKNIITRDESNKPYIYRLSNNNYTKFE